MVCPICVTQTTLAVCSAAAAMRAIATQNPKPIARPAPIVMKPVPILVNDQKSQLQLVLEEHDVIRMQAKRRFESEL